LSLSACVLLLTLWVRSTQRVELYYKSSETTVAWVWSCNGQAFFNVERVRGLSQIPDAELVEAFLQATKALRVDELITARESGICPVPQTNMFGFGWWGWNCFVVPYWFPLTVAASIGVAPWIHFSTRFSLRTLLILTTLVAIGLGAVIYLAR
jgi:hypothetical protein